MGPDMDIGNSPILKTLPNGKRVLIAGTKSGDVFALDPDNNGALLYRVNAIGGPIGGGRGSRASIVWGGAADAQHVYYGLGGAGLAALRQDTGERVWLFTPPPPAGGGRGSSAGRGADRDPRRRLRRRVRRHALRASRRPTASSSGRSIPAQTFDTVNKIPAHGGAISTSGAVVVGGMVFVGSGYAVGSGASARQRAAGVRGRVDERRSRQEPLRLPTVLRQTAR